MIAAERQLEIVVRNRDTAKALEDYARARLEAGQGSRLNHVRSLQQLGSAEGLVELAALLVRRAQEALGVAVFAPGPLDAKGEPTLPPAFVPADDAWLESAARHPALGRPSSWAPNASSPTPGRTGSPP